MSTQSLKLSDDRGQSSSFEHAVFESEQSLASNQLCKRRITEVIKKDGLAPCVLLSSRQFISFPRNLATAVSVPPWLESNELPP